MPLKLRLTFVCESLHLAMRTRLVPSVLLQTLLTNELAAHFMLQWISNHIQADCTLQCVHESVLHFLGSCPPAISM